MKDLPCDLTAEEWEEIQVSQDYKCAICGKELPLQKDHIIPVTKGGGFTKSNIQGLCISCNARKKDKIIEGGKMIEDNCDTELESLTGQEVEDALIATYVPEAGQMSREDALALALQRDEEFAMEFDVDWDEKEYDDELDCGYAEEDEDGE